MGIENRFQEYSANYDQPEGRQTELIDIKKIDKVPVFLINATPDGNCEEDEGVEQMAKDIPSFRKKYTLDPFTHNDFGYPVGEKGEEMMSYVFDSLENIKAEGVVMLGMIAATVALALTI